MKEFFIRLAYKATGFKFMFTTAVLGVLVLHDMSPENADVMITLVVTVLGAKAVQYGTGALMSIKSKDKEGDDGEAEV